MSEQQTLIDFDKMSNQGKKEYIMRGILRGTNFTDPFATTLDWSTPDRPITVPSVLVLSFLRHLDFDRICAELTGKKTPKEMFDIVFGFV